MSHQDSMQKKRFVPSGVAGALMPAALVVVLSAAISATAVDFTFVPRPQYVSNSCRSYALVLAVGNLPNTPFPIETVQQLRAAERDFQSRLEATAAEMGANLTPGHHQVWQRAIAELTSGAVEAVIEYKPTIEAFYSRVEELTGTGNAEQLGALFSSSVVRTPIMTSITKVGGNLYTPSHIVTVYGVASRNEHMSTLRALAILNPAVKVSNAQRNICEIDGVKNDERWSAMISLESSYDLNSFSGGYLVMWLRRK